MTALKEAQFKTDDGGLTFGELATEIGSSTKTLSHALRRLEKAKAISVKPVERAGRYTALYFLTATAEKTYPQVGISRKHYQELANKFDDSIRPKEFLQQFNVALTKTFVENWIVRKRGKRELTFEDIRAFMTDFDFLLRKYIVYRKNRQATPKKPFGLKELKELIRNIDQVNTDPEGFIAQFEELRSAMGEVE